MDNLTIIIVSVLTFIFLTLVMFSAVILILVKEAKRGTLNKLQRWVKSRKRINKRLKRRSKYGKRN